MAGRITDVWEVQADGNPALWLPASSRDALFAMRGGLAVRLVSALDAAVRLAHLELRVEPWVIRRGVRKAGGSVARALVCLCLRSVGWSEREVAEALGLAASSVHELCEKYVGEREIKRALWGWPGGAGLLSGGGA